MAALPAAIVELGAKLRQELGEKRTEAITAAGEDLRQRLQSQQERGFAQEEAAWTIEIAELRRHLGAKHLLTAANLDLLNQVEAAGREKIRRDRQDAWTRSWWSCSSIRRRWCWARSIQWGAYSFSTISTSRNFPRSR